MFDITSIQARDGLRQTLAAKMAAFEAECGPVQTLPIRIGDAPIPGFRIHCPDKPKAALRVRVRKPASERKPRANMLTKQQKIEAIRQLAAKGLRIEEIADQADFTPKLTRSYVLNTLRAHSIPRGPKTNLEA